MARGVCWYLVGFGVLGVLGVLAGCSGGSYFAEREPWRHQAEAQCLDSGAVKEGEGKVRIKAISGPGMCGADFPIKVSALGASAPVLSYGDELRPPGTIPNRPAATSLRWPGVPVPPAPGAPRYEAEPRYEQPLSLDPPPAAAQNGPTYQPYDFRKPFGGSGASPGRSSAGPLDPNSPPMICHPNLTTAAA